MLRWTLAPIALITLLVSGIFIVAGQDAFRVLSIYSILLVLQVFFYGLALLGYLTQKHPLPVKFVYAPFYFVAMNYAMYKGFFRFVKGKQTVLWEKAQRS